MIIYPTVSVEDRCREQMVKALNYETWNKAAAELDRLEGNDRWQQDSCSDDYDYRLINSRLMHMRTIASSGDIPSMMFLLRAGVIRNLGGICNAVLYQKSRIGTKTLIEDYVHEVVQQLDHIGRASGGELTAVEKRDFFMDLLHSFGRTALVLHGGTAFGLCHLGVAKALYEAGMLPKVICGSYIGALMAAYICTRGKRELGQALSGAMFNLDAFKGSGGIRASWRRKIVRFLQHGQIFDVRVLKECARDNFGDITFKEAFEKSGLVLNITVQSKRKHEVPALLNYVTAPDVVVWSAACASCSLPGVYDSVMLLTKDSQGNLAPWNLSSATAIRFEPAKYFQEAPMARLAELFNANNLIVSQVPSYWSWTSKSSDEYKRTLARSIFKFIGLEVQHRLWQMHQIGLLPRWASRFCSSPVRVQGDVVIMPVVFCADFKYLLANPTIDFARYCMSKGERAVWKQLGYVEMRCAIEFAIEDILSKPKVPWHENQLLYGSAALAFKLSGVSKITLVS